MNDVNLFQDGDAFFGGLRNNVPNQGNMNAQPALMAHQPWNYDVEGYDFDPLALFHHGPAPPPAPVQVINNAQPVAAQLPARPRVLHNRQQYGNFMPAPPPPGQGRVRTPSKARAPEAPAEVGNQGYPQVGQPQAVNSNNIRQQQLQALRRDAAREARVAAEQRQMLKDHERRAGQQAKLAGQLAMLAARQARHAAVPEEALQRLAQRPQQ